VLYRDY